MGASETPTAERYEVAILEKRLAASDLRNNRPAERDRQLPVSAAPRDPAGVTRKETLRSTQRCWV